MAAVALAWSLAGPIAPVAAATGAASHQDPAAATTAARLAAKGRPTVPGVVLVGYKPGTPTRTRAAARRFVHATSARSLSPIAGGAEKLTLPSVVSADAAISALRSNPDVRYAEPDYILRTDASSNDPALTDGTLWGMLSAGSAHPNAFGIGAIDAWAQGVTGSRNVVVGVVDEGIQVDHPDLAANIWTNPWDPVNGIDDDGNGYVDDVHGWDFLHDDNSVYDGPATDYHGTHVAGTIGGVGGNGQGVVGVDWSVTMISAKFLEETGDTADAIRALDYLTDLKIRHGLHIVATNDSWGGGPFSQALTDAINRGGDQDILFVAAAGNSGIDDDGPQAFYPAASRCDKHYPSGAPRGWDCIVSVAAIGRGGTLAGFSNFGHTSVDLGAPGVDIVSTYPPSGYASLEGTSMAAPHVTGALALLASCDYGLTPAQLRADLLAAATPTAALTAWTASGRRLDVARLIDAHCGAGVPPSAVITGPSGIGVGTSFTETVSFSRSVTGLVPADFTVGGTSAGWAVGGVTGSGSGPYSVTLTSGGPTDGTVVLTLETGSVSDGTSTGPTIATAGPTVHIDRLAPTVTIVAPPSPTKLTTLTATVAFNEPVIGFGANDLWTSGTATGCAVGAPTALGPATFAVQITGCSEGTVALSMAADTVTDRSSNSGPTANATSSVVTIDRTAATATLTAPASPTRASSPAWALTFSEPVTGLAAGDFTRSGSAPACTVGVPVKTGATTYSVPVNGCGTGTVALNLKASSLTDLGANVSPVAPVDGGSIVVDHSLPTTGVPVVTTRVGAVVGGSVAPIRVAWSGADVGTGVVRYELQRSINGGSFTTFSTTLTSPSTTMGLSSGASIRVRVRAVDATGNVGAWVTGPTVVASLVQQTTSSIHYAGTWSTSRSTSYSGGSARASSKPSSSATWTFTGRGIALVSTMATTRGTVRIYLDGKYVTRVDMLASPTVFRAVAWQATWSSTRSRTIKVVVDGLIGRPRIDLDAFIVLK